MNIYDKTHELAKELKNCPEVVSLKQAHEKVKSNEGSKKMLEDFRKIQIEAYGEQVQSGKISKETEEKFKNIGSVISLNPDLAQYIQAEQRFAVMWEDIIKILNAAIDIDMSFGGNK